MHDAALTPRQRTARRRPARSRAVGRNVGGCFPPLHDDSLVPGLLNQRGKGFYHLAFEADALFGLVQELKSRGIKPMNGTPRQGLEGCRLVNPEIEETFGPMT